MFVRFLLYLRGIFRLFCLVMILCALVVLSVLSFFSNTFTLWWHKWITKLSLIVLGVQVKVIGKQKHDRPQLIVSNHLSFLDFFAVNSNENTFFVMKEEIGHIPFFGFFARMGFISTSRSRKTTQLDVNNIASYLIKGYNVAVFPESTTTSGNLIPFHSSMFAACSEAQKATNSDILIQPISLVYTKYNGLPMNTKILSDFAWHSGRSLLSKVLDLVFAIGITEVYVVYHKAIVFDGSSNRKDVSAAAENVIRLTLSNYKKYGQIALI